jgi:hypothetical protein
MMKQKTSQEKEKKAGDIEEENMELKGRVSLLQDLVNLKDETYFRQQLLILLERIAKALETSLEESKEKDENA